MKKIKSNKIILDTELFDGYIYFDNGKITEISKANRAADEEFDLTGYYVSPGFIDMHTHGGGGFSFDGEVEDIIAACNFHLKHGTTAMTPTLTTDAIERMASSVEKIALAMNDPRTLGTIIGAHLEGPYFSRKQTGAQCPEAITPPIEEDYIPILEKHSNVIARWSYAPENDKDERFVKALKKYSVLSAFGHTDAIYDDVVKAMEHGCKLVTHLYSCTSTITRDHGFRRLGVIECAYLFDDIFVEIICDGKHLPPELIKLIYKLKGSDKIALITDSIPIAGTDCTHGSLVGTEFIIEDGVAKLKDRSAFAGSIATADRLVRVAVFEAGIPLLEAVKMITKIPAEIMHLDNKGKIAPGFDADIIAFDDNINIKSIFALGQSIPI